MRRRGELLDVAGRESVRVRRNDLPFFLWSGACPAGVERVMSFRVLGPHERGRFAPDAWGHLLGLARTGALNAAELEHVIERALLQIDGRIALDDLRSLMEGAGFEDPGAGGENQTIH